MKLQAKFVVILFLLSMVLGASLAWTLQTTFRQILSSADPPFVNRSPQEIAAIERRFFRRIIPGLFIIAVAGFGGVVISVRRLLGPIRQLSAAAAQIRGGHPVEMVVSSEDELGQMAGALNQMSRALAETTGFKDFMSRILANLIDPLIVMGPDTAIRLVNPAACRLLGYSEAEMAGQPLSLLCPEEERRLVDGEEGNRLRQRTLHNLEMSMLSKNGRKIPMLFSSAVIKEADGAVTMIIAVAKDMTERKKLERQLMQTSKLAAVGQLAGGVAHEINNPLTVILGFAQSLVRLVEPGHSFEHPLKAIEREALRCKNLVQDLLTFSRTSKAEREAMDLNASVEGALSLVMAKARIGHIEIRKELGADLPYMVGNPNQIQQIIINLANNALDAMGSHGVLTIRTQWTSPWLSLSILDTGSGIPPEISAHLFEPFFTTKPLGQGTGLGLSLIHQIVQKHSGTIEVNSRPGCTEFRIKFPVHVFVNKSRDFQ